MERREERGRAGRRGVGVQRTATGFIPSYSFLKIFLHRRHYTLLRLPSGESPLSVLCGQCGLLTLGCGVQVGRSGAAAERFLRRSASIAAGRLIFQATQDVRAELSLRANSRGRFTIGVKRPL